VRTRRALEDAEAVRTHAETTHRAKSWGKDRRVVARIEATRLITEELGITLEKVTAEHFGKAAKVRVSKETCTIIKGAGSKKAITDRCNQIRKQIENTKSDYDREKLEERLAKLSSGIGVIKVGGKTEAEMKSYKDLVEDALNATRAAIAEGVVPGGGVCLLHAAQAVAEARAGSRFRGDEKFGATIIEKALQEPIRRISENAGHDGSVVAETVREKSRTTAFDALSGTYVDAFKAGIIDPAKVVRCALQNAASIAGLLLTTDSMVTDLKDEQENVAGSLA
jgi:chaperonin GroEL